MRWVKSDEACETSVGTSLEVFGRCLAELCHLVHICERQDAHGVRQGSPKSHTPEETRVVVPLGTLEEKGDASGPFVAPGHRAKVVVV